MACIALSGFIYTVVLKLRRNDPIGDILVKALDLITIVVPPELPAALTIALIFVDNRLRMNKIYCISPRSINISGCINCMCFDKTGTLTEDDLSFAEILPIRSDTNQFDSPLTSIDKLEVSPLLICLASCHSLTILNGEVVGDPLDIKMFETTKWVLEEPEVNDSNKFDLLAPTIVKPSYVKGESDKPQVGIVRQFPFSSNLSRMSVITRLLGANEFELYVKVIIH
jgi:cation-transporting ATPase 13A3/4/5